ncbi:hypothetical protein EVAR_27991_1 [Eumeta japonica]|uniref:Uncharacterized protein n=1 Tax=Eumeta variegata TaxID=151549 RepID=A0A4C1WEQ6_EUMVA|nr:hypothetical protein EVAR_27991_1 [Eumeta japonica]
MACRVEHLLALLSYRVHTSIKIFNIILPSIGKGSTDATGLRRELIVAGRPNTKMNNADLSRDRLRRKSPRCLCARARAALRALASGHIK